MPPISMSIKARYITQQSRWSSPFTGLLTDRRIAYYQRLGYYGAVVKRNAEIKQKAKQKKILEEFVC